jgi:hypothetical protein
MAAFNYMIQAPNMEQQAWAGFERGFALNEAQRQRQMQEQYQQTIDPARIKEMQPLFDQMGKQPMQEKLSRGIQFLSAVKMGQPDTAKGIVQFEIDAARNGGDEQLARYWEGVQRSVDASPTAAFGGVAAMVGMIPGGKEALASILEENKSRADIASTEATTEKTRAETGKIGAEAKIAEIRAKFEPDKIRADLGLTSAQTQQARASAASSYASADASRASAAKSAAEARQANAGIIPLDKRPEAETKFRKEYIDQTAVYRETKNAYSRVLASKPGAVGDIALIYGYMKMQDPGSVVREGEYATAENARGVQDTVRNLYNRVMSGQRLTDKQRDEFKSQAKSTYEAALKEEKQVRNGIGRIASGYGLNTDNIFYTGNEERPDAGRPAQPTQQRNIVVDF